MNADVPSIIGQLISEVTANEHSWLFRFSDGTTLNVECPWRIVADNNVSLGSSDHEQLFGLSEPVNGEERATSLLGESAITSVSIGDKTSDLEIVCANNARLELFNYSAGYESWTIICPDGSQFIGAGGGRLAKIEKRTE